MRERSNTASVPGRSKGHAAGDLDALRIDPAVFLGKEHGNHRPDVMRHAGAAEGREPGKGSVREWLLGQMAGGAAAVM